MHCVVWKNPNKNLCFFHLNQCKQHHANNVLLFTGRLFYVYLIKRDVLSHHAAQAVDEGRESDGTWSVAVAPNLSSRPCEVKHRTALRWWRFLYVLSHIHSEKLFNLFFFSFSLLTSSSLIWTRSLIGVPSSMKSSDSTSKDPVWCCLRRAKSLSMSLTASSALLCNTNTEALAQKKTAVLKVLFSSQLPECIPCRLGPQLTRSCQSTPPPADCLSDWPPPEPAGLTGCHGDYESQSSLGTGPEPSELQLQLIWRQRGEEREESRGGEINRTKQF